MTDFDDFMSDADDDLFDLYGQVITYTPKGGSPVSRTAILGTKQIDDEPDELGRVKRTICDLTISLDPDIGVAEPEPGDTVTIGGVVWQVDSITEQTGTTSVLNIRTDTDVRKHSETQYKRIGGS